MGSDGGTVMSNQRDAAENERAWMAEWAQELDAAAHHLVLEALDIREGRRCPACGSNVRPERWNEPYTGPDGHDAVHYECTNDEWHGTRPDAIDDLVCDFGPYLITNSARVYVDWSAVLAEALHAFHPVGARRKFDAMTPPLGVERWSLGWEAPNTGEST